MTETNTAVADVRMTRVELSALVPDPDNANEHPDENIFAMSNARFWKFLGEAESSSRSITLSGLDFDRLEVGRLEVPLPESEYDCFIPISLDLCGFSVPPSEAFFT